MARRDLTYSGLVEASAGTSTKRDDRAVRGTKTHKSRREVPLTAAAVAALDSVPPQVDSRYVFTTSRKVQVATSRGPFDVANFRRRV